MILSLQQVCFVNGFPSNICKELIFNHYWIAELRFRSQNSALVELSSVQMAMLSQLPPTGNPICIGTETTLIFILISHPQRIRRNGRHRRVKDY